MSTLEQRWMNVAKDWYSIYQWSSVRTPCHSEEISRLILRDYKKITLNLQGIRENGFRVPQHHGQCQRKRTARLGTEKHIVRAMFNRKRFDRIGRVIDYEVPLKANQKAKHGAIDALIETPEGLLLAEVKDHESAESLLRAVLEAYVRARVAQRHRSQFFRDYGLQDRGLCPVVVCFRGTPAAEELAAPHADIKKLIAKLDSALENEDIRRLRFFVINNPRDKVSSSLMETALDHRYVRVEFRPEFRLNVTEINGNRSEW